MYVCLYVSLLILHHLKRKISKVWAEYVSVLNVQILKKRRSLQLTKIILSLQVKYSPCFPYILMKRKKNSRKVSEQLHHLKFSSSSVSYAEKLNTLKRIMETVNPFHKQNKNLSSSTFLRRFKTHSNNSRGSFNLNTHAC